VNPVFKKKISACDRFSVVRSVMEELKIIMYQEDGVGLAAPQLGISLRFSVWMTAAVSNDSQSRDNRKV